MLNHQTVPDPVQWFEGMLLSPQHFQQNNLYLERLISHHTKLASPFGWGLLQCKRELKQDILSISKLEAVMTDGTVVNFPTEQPNHAAPGVGVPTVPTLRLDLGSLKAEELPDKFFVLLALPKVNKACASDADTDLKRYKSINTGIEFDHNDASNQVDLTRLVHVLRLVPEMHLPNYTTFPVARIRKTAAGGFELLDYSPPILEVSRASAPDGATLADTVSQLLASIRERADMLKSPLKQNRLDTASRRQKLFYLTNGLPKVELLLTSGVCHPFTMYQALVDLAANIAAINSDPIPGTFSDYDHDDLDKTFDDVIDFIEEVLREINIDYKEHLLTRNDAGEYRGEVSGPRTNIMLRFTLRNGVTREQLTAWIENAIVTTEQDYASVNLDRDLGFTERQRVSEFSDLDIVESDSEVLYQIETEDAFKASQRLVISCSEDDLTNFEPESISLLDPIKEQAR